MIADLQALHLEWVSRSYELEYQVRRGVLPIEDIRHLSLLARQANNDYLTAVALRPAPKVKKDSSRTPAQLSAARHYAEAKQCQAMWEAAEDIARTEVKRGVMSGELLGVICQNAQAWFEEYDDAIGDTATSTRQELAHKALIEARKEDTDIQELAQSLESSWLEWTTEELEPPNEVLTSSLRCNGPPSRLVYESSNLNYSPNSVVIGQGEPSR